MPVMQFFSFAERTGRAGWAAWFVAFCAIVWAGAVALTRVDGALLVAIYALLGLAAAKLTTQTIRRVHDRGQSGWIGLGVCVGIVALLVSAMLRWSGDGVDSLFWGLIVVAIGAGAILVLRPGDSGPNVYASSPGASATDTVRPSPVGAIAAAIWVTAGIAFGFAALSWQAGIDRQREQRMRMATPQTPAQPSAAAARRTGIDAENDALSNRIDTLLNTKDTK